nr:hypothetical protein [Tanacetum cinerariifolium]
LTTKTAQKLLENVIALYLKTVNKRDSTLAKRNKHVTFVEPLEILANNTSTQPKSNTKIDRTLKAKSRHKKNVEAHHRNNKSDLHKKNRIDSGISFKRAVVNSNSNSRCKTSVAAPRAVNPADSPSSTTIDQDVSSASTSPTTQEIQSQVTHQGAEEQIHGH